MENAAPLYALLAGLVVILGALVAAGHPPFQACPRAIASALHFRSHLTTLHRGALAFANAPHVAILCCACIFLNAVVEVWVHGQWLLLHFSRHRSLFESVWTSSLVGIGGFVLPVWGMIEPLTALILGIGGLRALWTTQRRASAAAITISSLFICVLTALPLLPWEILPQTELVYAASFFARLVLFAATFGTTATLMARGSDVAHAVARGVEMMPTLALVFLPMMISGLPVPDSAVPYSKALEIVAGIAVTPVAYVCVFHRIGPRGAIRRVWQGERYTESVGFVMFAMFVLTICNLVVGAARLDGDSEAYVKAGYGLVFEPLFMLLVAGAMCVKTAEAADPTVAETTPPTVPGDHL